jgi:hypothetical protein
MCSKAQDQEIEWIYNSSTETDKLPSVYKRETQPASCNGLRLYCPDQSPRSVDGIGAA